MSQYQAEIRRIQNNATLSTQEKSRQINEIMMKNSLLKQQSNLSKECSHYEKSCSHFEFSCCSVIDPCHRCHLERNTCNDIQVKAIVCCFCDTKQDPSAQCCKCQETFSTNYCAICTIWTKSNIFHCNECGICRIGSRETTFHCHECNACFSNSNQSNHLCFNNSFKDGTCVVCNESVFNNQHTSFPLQCGHFIHNPCFEKYIHFGNYNCPYCKKSICDLTHNWQAIREAIQQTPIPKDFIVLQENNVVPSKYGRFRIQSIEGKMYFGKLIDWKLKNGELVNACLHEDSITKNIYMNIYCNDCCKKSFVLYHFYGLECEHCQSFNTQQ